MIGTGVAFVSHLVVIYGCKNAALDHVIAASSSSWLQEHVSDISQRCAWVECLCLPVKSQMNKKLYFLEDMILMVFVDRVLKRVSESQRIQ